MLEQPFDYTTFLTDLKTQIIASRTKAALAVNRELILLYWNIGKRILEQQKRQGWGAKVIEQLAKDLRLEFPDMQGFSRTNLLYMRAFADAYPNAEFVQQVVGQLPWGQNLRLLDKLDSFELREWYAKACIQNGWSRPILEAQIETKLHQRQGAAVNNFARTLPALQSELASQMLKDPYIFDFLSLGQEATMPVRCVLWSRSSRARPRAWFVGAHQSLSARVRGWIRAGWQSVSSRGKWQRLLFGFAVLPLSFALLCGD